MAKSTSNIQEYLRKKALGFLGLADSQVNPNSDRLTFVNDMAAVQRSKIREYNVWYSGDSDEILNFYTKQNMVDYNYEPYFDRNKTSYFWAVASTESDIKRTHSGLPRDIIDTLVNIIGTFKEQCNTDAAQAKLKAILKKNKLQTIVKQKQMPLTLVEGWGCFKINWNKKLSPYPIIIYYRAENVDFIYKSNQLIACVFKDYYYDEKGNKYILFETRSRGVQKNAEDGIEYPCLYIEKELFRLGEDGNSIIPTNIKNIPQLEDMQTKLVITNYHGLLAVPSIFFKDTETDNLGRSLFTGKIDLFDDLDQCLSQASNTVRRSTVMEYFDTDFLERDSKTGMPIMPATFDRKYTMFRSPKSGDGQSVRSDPIQVTQPKVDFAQYNEEAISIILQIINGVMSPATLGIDIAKKDNAEAQREKEKVTIFTRNTIIAEETEILEDLCRELLCAEELMRTGEITFDDYVIAIEFDEFSDASFEGKVETLLTLKNADAISPELFIHKLYGDTLSPTVVEKELKYIKQAMEKEQNASAVPGQDAENPMYTDEELAEFGKLGADGGGYNNKKATPSAKTGIAVPIKAEK